MGIPEGPDALDRKELQELIREAVRSDRAEIGGWDGEVLAAGLGSRIGDNSLVRLRRTGDGVLGRERWSVIVKLFPKTEDGIVAPAQSGDVTAPSYWKREVLAYESDLLTDLPSGFAAPRCYAVWDQPEAVWLLMEDITESDAAPWSIDRYALAARHLGRFNGHYLATRPIPTFPWLGQSLARARCREREAIWSGLARLREDPLVRRGWPGDLFDRCLALWSARGPLLDALDRLPQTLCHNDAHRRNLLARKTVAGLDETVAIDWAFVGPGPIGSELATLVGLTVLWFEGIEPDQLPRLADACFQGYLEGLHEVGWVGGASPARLGFTASLALRYGAALGSTALVLPGEQSRRRRASVARALGHTAEELLDRGAQMLGYVLDRGDEALALAGARQCLEAGERGPDV